jgi:putative ABC transport system ATP-binding protein
VGGLSGDERAHLRSTRIGFVFQTFNLLRRLSALQNVTLPLLYQGRLPSASQRAAEALERVGLGERTDHRPSQLSGGECQRVAIARALVTEPAIILADEPTGNLDTATGAAIMSLLCDLNSEGCTVLTVTHSPQVAGYAARILHMCDGRIVPHPADPSGSEEGQGSSHSTRAGRCHDRN